MKQASMTRQFVVLISLSFIVSFNGCVQGVDTIASSSPAPSMNSNANSNSPNPTSSPDRSPQSSQSSTPSPTPHASPSPTPSLTPRPTPSPTPSSTPNPSSSSTPNPTSSSNPSPTPSSSPSSSPSPTPSSNPFGDKEIYPTTPGGRVWYLPSNADTNTSGDWYPEYIPVAKNADGSFHVPGPSQPSNTQVRLSVRSGQVGATSEAWWRDVEMTMYVRPTFYVSGASQTPHFEIFARGEQHTSNTVLRSQINNGVEAPPGTVTWPWYESMPLNTTINSHCVGTAYHGNFYPQTGAYHAEKEISHSSGYASSLESGTIPNWTDSLNRWIGLKLVLRNSGSNDVYEELWINPNADGQTWNLLFSLTDSGNWSASGSLDSCGASPYNYSSNQVMNWQSPWVTFRSDSLGLDFKGLSVREIGPK